MPEQSQNPLDGALYLELAAARRAAGDELGALAHLIAARTLDACAAGVSPAPVAELCNVATGYFMKGDYDVAARWYELVLRLDPGVAAAWQNLAAIHAQAGRGAQAADCRERAYRLQRVFVEQAGDALRRVLVLCSGRSDGNVPFEVLLPGTSCCRIKYAIDYADDAEDERLPPFDLVFNAIGDPDVAAPLAGRLERFAARSRRPVLNAPAAVVQTQRHRLAGLLDGIDGVATAPCMRSEASAGMPAPSVLASGGLAFPMLARPVSTHGGEGLVLCEGFEALAHLLSTRTGAQYLTGFRDTRSADGYYRKYRVIFVDREPFPYHLAISPQWMVHYFSADMEGHAWKLAEERRFLREPRATLGDRAMNAIAAIGRRLGLDYGGIDFTLLPDGQVFVFEANAAMRVHHERETGALAYKNPHVWRIVDAFERMMARRAAD